MAGRPYWSGQLKISLVSFGIELFPATKSQAEVSFHQIDRATGQRVHHLNVIDGDHPVDNSEIIKGYEFSKGQFITLEPEEIAKLRVPSKSMIEIAQFVALEDLSPSLFETPFFVIPHPKESADAFAVVRKAMEQTGKAGIGELAFGGREHLVAIAVPPDKSFRGLMAYTLRYSNQMRKSEGYFSAPTDSKVDKKQLEMASELIRSYSSSSPLNLDAFKDDYQDALRQLIDAKRKNMPLPLEVKSPKRDKVTNLMDALRQSLSHAKRPPAGQKPLSAASSKTGPMLVKAKTRKRRAA